MIELSRVLARQFRAVLRRSLLEQESRGSWPVLLCRADEKGLTLEAQHKEVAVRYHQAGKRSSEAIAFRANVLAEFEGRREATVKLEQVRKGKGRACWNDGNVPRFLDFDTIEPDGVLAYPSLPSKLVPMPQEFLAALFEAAQTTPRDGQRVALSRVQLRGKDGAVIATDGRQLLVQGGFHLPWRDDVLLPRVSAFGSRELLAAGNIQLGRTPSQVAILVGNWTFLLALDTTSRFPVVENVIPPVTAARSRVRFATEDATFLAATLAKLPGDKEDHAPVTLDLNTSVSVRVREENSETITEVILSRSLGSGAAVRVCMDRRLLRRALQLGFTEVEITSPDMPLVARDPHRTFVWMPLDKNGVLSASPNALRIASAHPAEVINTKSLPQPVVPERKSASMPVPPNNGQSPRNGIPANGPSTDARHQGGIAGLIDEAESVRLMLHEAQGRLSRLIVALKEQRKQSRAVQQALGSLRQLKQLDS